MSDRVGDVAASVPLVQTTVSATGGGRIIGRTTATDLRQYRAAQLNIAAQGVSGGGGADTLDVKMQESDPEILNAQINAYDGTDDGSEKLRDGAASNLEFGIPFTPPANITISKIGLQLSRLGTIAAGKYIGISIETDAAGDPSNTKVSGAQALQVSRKVDPTLIATTRAEQVFYFDDAVDLTAATQYWIILEGDYATSAVNCIQLHYNTVAGTSGCKFFDAAWAASVNIDYWFRIWGLTFADVAGLTHAQITEGWLNYLDTAERIEVPLKPRKSVMRAHYTPSGGTWTLGHGFTMGYPRVQPAV